MFDREAYLSPLAPERDVTAADIVNCYRLLLAREPERHAVAAEAARHPLATIIATIIASDEMALLVALTGGVVVAETMLSSLEPDLLAWTRALVPDTASAERVLDRLSAIRALLANENVRRIVATLEPDRQVRLALVEVGLAKLREDASLIAGSTLFDAALYRRQLAPDSCIDDPAVHYLLHGERRGYRASAHFSAATYRALHADIGSANALLHYERYGRLEGRPHRHWLDMLVMPEVPQEAGRPTILILLHAADRTGAPILGWNLVRALSDRYNVVVVPRRGGALEPALQDAAAAVLPPPPPAAIGDAQQMDRFAARLIETYRPLYVIANSVESWPLAVPLGRRGAPVLALIHEFWPGAVPSNQLPLYAASAALIFPAQLVEKSSRRAFREVGLQPRYVLPQGRSALPRLANEAPPAPLPPALVAKGGPEATLSDLLRDGGRGVGPFTVIGLGAVEMRKGIDLFMAAATALRARHPDLSFRFLWIGTWEHAVGSDHAALLYEQHARANLGDAFRFFPAVDDLEPVYARADALFLSSRLDPLPNVAIDAACCGIPVVCFAQASGFADLLLDDPALADLVVPHLDAGAAAERILAMAHDPELWRSRSEAMRSLGRRTFDMQAYASSLDAIGRAAARKIAGAPREARLIEGAGAFDPLLYFTPEQPLLTGPEGIARYLDATRHINFASRPVPGAILRRPKAGFHPFIYGNEAPGFPRDGSRDPLAHFVESGMPDGRWTHPVLQPKARGDGPSSAARQLSAAIHAHFHYTDDIGSFMDALEVNRLEADLYVTTNSAAAAEELRPAMAGYRQGSVELRIVPNVGRDIFPFVDLLKTRIHGRYDVVGHLHGKRTVHASELDPQFGSRWRRFLWEHLIGPQHAMADLVIDAFAEDPSLGLIFPENGYLIGWEQNAEGAATLARRFDLPEALPGHIEFPAGTMFWGRAEALRALADADLRIEEMPEEPLPIDGTLLHAIERMLPLVCEAAGFTYATTHIQNVRR